MVTANQIAEKGITMYMVGCEPSINPYRDWFMAIAHITNGQYVPLANATFLSQVIIGGAQEEIALQRLLEEVNRDVVQEAQDLGEALDEDALAEKVHTKLKSKGMQLILDFILADRMRLEAIFHFQHSYVFVILKYQ